MSGIGYIGNADIPYIFAFVFGSAVTIGTDIYLFGGTYDDTAYKYNTDTGIYTRLNDIPYEFWQGSSVVIGTDIYLLGGEKFPRCNCKCNILTYDMNSVKIENVKYVKNSGI